MKKISRFAIAAALVASVALMSVSSVFADSTTDWPDPTAVANEPSASLATAVVSISALPGTINPDSGMILPVGLDYAQFGGNGITLSGLTSTESAKLCFAFPVAQYYWNGTIYEWDGSAWTAMPTTRVAPTGEDSMYYACTYKAGNGTYSLLTEYDAAAAAAAEE
jgi:hypothetical protein